MADAYLLVSHGSRDPRPYVAMEQLAKLVSQKLPNHSENLVGVGTLEFNSQPLHQQVVEFAQIVADLNCNYLKILPLFLSPGVHLKIDIPAELVLAQQIIWEKIHPKLAVELQPFLGSHPDLRKLFSQEMAQMNADATILLAHGSRRLDAQSSVSAVAKDLGAVVAYWSINPSLSLQVSQLVAGGKQKIAILPYFLFSGRITDAIARAVSQLELEFPHITFPLAPPLGASGELAQMIWDLAMG